jgi:hypothetical protein
VSITEHTTLEQGSDEWLNLRRGMVTASVVGQLITASTLKPARNDYSRGLTASLVAERITGHIDPVYVSDDMYRGTVEEPLARDLYAKHHKVTVREVGFITREIDGVTIGFSPDGLVGEDGLIEVKSRKQKKQLSTILSGLVPAENVAQCQTGLLVSGRKWLDYVSYSAGMPLFVTRVYPDQNWQAAIIAAVQAFEETAAQMVADYEAAVVGLPVAERTVELEMVI